MSETMAILDNDKQQPKFQTEKAKKSEGQQILLVSFHKTMQSLISPCLIRTFSDILFPTRRNTMCLLHFIETL